jgi:hypothetical protein
METCNVVLFSNSNIWKKEYFELIQGFAILGIHIKLNLLGLYVVRSVESVDLSFSVLVSWTIRNFGAKFNQFACPVNFCYLIFRHMAGSPPPPPSLH